jgi:hypothetical protein
MVEFEREYVEFDGLSEYLHRGRRQCPLEMAPSARQVPLPVLEFLGSVQIAQEELDCRRVARIFMKILVRSRQAGGLPALQLAQARDQIGCLARGGLELSLAAARQSAPRFDLPGC